MIGLAGEIEAWGEHCTLCKGPVLHLTMQKTLSTGFGNCACVSVHHGHCSPKGLTCVYVDKSIISIFSTLFVSEFMSPL